MRIPPTLRAGMKLPESFTVPDDQGNTGGCELAFMSTSLDKEVASAAAGVAATVIQAKMSTQFKGAVVNWLSQVPLALSTLRPATPHMQAFFGSRATRQ